MKKCVKIKIKMKNELYIYCIMRSNALYTYVALHDTIYKFFGKNCILIPLKFFFKENFYGFLKN